LRVNATKAKLKAGETVFGCFYRYPEAGIVEVLGYYGWDFILFDAEHGTITPRDCENLVRAAELRDVTPLIRVTTNTPPVTLRFLDTGVQGVQMPMINTKADAEAAVRSVKFHPRGTRGLAGSRAADYAQTQPFSFRDYTAQANAETMVIVQVETAAAVEMLPEIVQVPDIDVIFIGPSDLSHSYGVPGDLQHPKVQEAMNQIIAVVEGTDIALGTLVPNAQAARQWQERGARYIVVGFEALLGPACRGFLQAVRSQG